LCDWRREQIAPFFSWGWGIASPPDFVVAQFIGQPDESGNYIDENLKIKRQNDRAVSG